LKRTPFPPLPENKNGLDADSDKRSQIVPKRGNNGSFLSVEATLFYVL
jgi:hypothetical protein